MHISSYTVPRWKAPHHTQTSWTSHWHSRHDLADKILAAARNEETCESTTDDSSSDVDAEGTVDDDEEPITTHGYKRQADPDNDSDSSDSASEEALTSEESVDSSEDEKQMGEGGDALTKADMRFMAKHIAASQDREAAGGNDGWLLFSKRVCSEVCDMASILILVRFSFLGDLLKFGHIIITDARRV